MAIFPGSAIPSAAEDYTIDNSLRFEKGDSTYLSRTPSSAGDRKTWTWSGWIKKTENENSSYQALWTAETSGGGGTSDGIWFNPDDVIYFYFGGLKIYPNKS